MQLSPTKCAQHVHVCVMHGGNVNIELLTYSQSGKYRNAANHRIKFVPKKLVPGLQVHGPIFIMPPPRGHYAVIGVGRPSVRPSVCLSVRLSDVAYIGSNSKTKRPRKTKLCTGIPQVTCDSHTDFKVKRSKLKVTGGSILWRPPSRTACFSCLTALCLFFINILQQYNGSALNITIATSQLSVAHPLALTYHRQSVIHSP